MSSIKQNSNFFKKYNLIKQNDIHYKTSFELQHIPIYLANSLRRVLSSRIPIITFDDTFYEDISLRTIQIKKNTGVLHNEFLSHRLSLIPINMNNNNLKISTKFNIDSGKRDYILNENSPIFTLKKKNDYSNTPVDVLSSDIISSIEANNNYFNTDPFTNEFILINKLNYRDSDFEELDITLKPTIGIGSTHARYDPTGTVTYQFKNDKSKFDNIISKKIKYFEKEKQIKNNNSNDKLSESEINAIKKNFNLLDKERVYFKDNLGIANVFEMSVESIGFMTPDQIIQRGLFMLSLLLDDILKSVDLTKNPLNINNKLYITNTSSEYTIPGVLITIYNEDHTLGNLIGSYIRKIYYHENKFLSNISYRMDHPTINEIEIFIFPEKSMIDNSFKLIKKFLTDNNIEIPDNDNDLLLLFGTVLFIKSIQECQKLVDELLIDFEKISECPLLSKFKNLLENI
jgi:DNA-directed RNA polymerase subunit L/DNA-directed RNA polymerase alpha subunit